MPLHRIHVPMLHRHSHATSPLTRHHHRLRRRHHRLSPRPPSAAHVRRATVRRRSSWSTPPTATVCPPPCVPRRRDRRRSSHMHRPPQPPPWRLPPTSRLRAPRARMRSAGRVDSHNRQPAKRRPPRACCSRRRADGSPSLVSEADGVRRRRAARPRAHRLLEAVAVQRRSTQRVATRPPESMRWRRPS
jgi:hypothetical protein